MRRPDELDRNFDKPDGEMLSQAEVFHANIREDKPHFEGFDPMFNDAYIDNFKNKIDGAYALKSDDYWVDFINQTTILLKQDIEEAKHVFFSIEHFVDKLESTIPGIKIRFGYNNYGTAKNSQTRFILLMDTFNEVAIEYTADLLTTGLTQAQIDNIGAVYEKIRTANKNQEKAKSDRQIATKHRVKTLNGVWAIMGEISGAAKIIFADDIGHYERYLLYEGESASGSHEYHGNVPAGQTVSVLLDVEPDMNLHLKNPGATVLEYCLGETPEPCSGGIELNPGDEHQTTASEMGTGSILKCTNKSETEEGMYEVEVS